MDKARITLRIDATPDEINQVLRRFTLFINNSLQIMKMQMYFEPVDTGVLIFFNRFEDFQMFHQMIQQLADYIPHSKDMILPTPDSHKEWAIEQPVVMTFEIMFNHSEKSIHELIENIIKSYQKVTQEVQINRVSEKNAILTYPNMKIFKNLIAIVQNFLEQANEKKA